MFRQTPTHSNAPERSLFLQRSARGLLLSGLLIVLVACGGGGSGGTTALPIVPPIVQGPPPVQPEPPVVRYTVGGRIEGLVGSGLVLQNNAGDDLTVAADGAFRFTTALASGAAYAVRVKTEPTGPSQICSVNFGSGTIKDVAIDSVAVVCATTSYAISGKVVGLVGAGLVLQNNSGDDLTIAADGAFRFAAPVASGAKYAATVKTQPTNPAQTCTVDNASATVADVDITNVAVRCSTNSYTIGGVVTGLMGRGLVLQNNAGDDLAIDISAPGTFSFATPVISGGTYNVTVKAQPQFLSQTCTVGNASGPVTTTSVTSIAVNCVTTPSALAPARFAYVANQNSNSVSAYAVGNDGTLSPTSSFAAERQPFFVGSDPTGRFAYTANWGAPSVSAYVIDAGTGALTPVPGSPFSSGGHPVAGAFDPKGRFFYMVNIDMRSIAAYRIDASTGALTQLSGSPFATGRGPQGIAIDPLGRFAYVTAAGDSMWAYAIDANTGALIEVPGSPFAAGALPVKAAVDPTGRFVYATNLDGDNVSAYRIDGNTGALTPVDGSPFAAGVNPAGVAIDPAGRYAYVANRGSNSVSTYAINRVSGALSPIGAPIATTGLGPFPIAIDPSGRFVYTGNQNSDSLSAYAIDADTGALTPMRVPTIATGLAPTSIAFTK